TQIPVQMQIENFDVSPFLCGAIALSLLYAAYASQTLRGALKAVPQGQWESGQGMAPHLRHHQTEEYGRFRQPQRLAGLP
ncbi:hypothetical protein ACQ4T2_25670, partial [Escherichia coli]